VTLAPLELSPIQGGSLRRELFRRVLAVATVGLAGLLLILSLIPTGVWQALSEDAAPRITVRSIDTAKYSRDLASQMLRDPSFDQVIYRQVSAIAQAHANYVALDTPYDDEFLPFLQRWVQAARINHLHVWFRGNFAGWEGWFGYHKINRAQHLAKVQAFIHRHPDLFQDGDLFSPCPECENGGPGDPRLNGDVEGFRAFTIAEYRACQQAFQDIGKRVASNYNSMNFDVARLVMDRDTTAALQHIVVIDHYVARPAELASDIDMLAESSGGKVILGEFGAPIPDINGQMSGPQQAAWVRQAVAATVADPNVAGLNYWTSVGGSTELWDESGDARPAAGVLATSYAAMQTDPIWSIAGRLAQVVEDMHVFYGHLL
jgi:hypothetical protein